MDALPTLLPFGGPAALLIILVRQLVHQSHEWRKERAELVEEHREDVTDIEARYDRAIAEQEGRYQRTIADIEARAERARQDYESHVGQLRDRIKDLERQVVGLRNDIQALTGRGGEAS